MRCPGTRDRAIAVGSDGKSKCLVCGKRVGINPAARTLRPHAPPKEVVDDFKREMIYSVAALVRHHVGALEAAFIFESAELAGIVGADASALPADVEQWVRAFGEGLARKVEAMAPPARACGVCGRPADKNARHGWRCATCNPFRPEENPLRARLLKRAQDRRDRGEDD